MALGAVRILPSLQDLAGHDPECVVINLMHDSPCRIDMAGGTKAVWVKPSPRFARIIPSGLFERMNAGESGILPADCGETYRKRFSLFSQEVRRLFPRTRIVLYKRLSHSKSYGVHLKSDLRHWSEMWAGSRAWLEALASDLGNAWVLDMDECAAVVLDEKCALERVAPRHLDKKVTPEAMQVWACRDLEHISESMVARVAQAVAVGGPPVLSRGAKGLYEKILAEAPLGEVDDVPTSLEAEQLASPEVFVERAAGFISAGREVDWSALAEGLHGANHSFTSLNTLSVLALVFHCPDASVFFKRLYGDMQFGVMDAKIVEAGRSDIERAIRQLQLMHEGFAPLLERPLALACTPEVNRSLGRFMAARGAEPAFVQDVDVVADARLVAEVFCRKVGSKALVVGTGLTSGPGRMCASEVLEAVHAAEGHLTIL